MNKNRLQPRVALTRGAKESQSNYLLSARFGQEAETVRANLQTNIRGLFGAEGKRFVHLPSYVYDKPIGLPTFAHHETTAFDHERPIVVDTNPAGANYSVGQQTADRIWRDPAGFFHGLRAHWVGEDRLSGKFIARAYATQRLLAEARERRVRLTYDEASRIASPVIRQVLNGIVEQSAQRKAAGRR